MSVKLNTKIYDAYGYNVLGSDLTGSDKWIHAGTKSGLDKKTVTKSFDYYQNHGLFNAARVASGFLGNNKPVEEQLKAAGTSNFGTILSGGPRVNTRGLDIGRTPWVSQDYFADLRLDNKDGFFKDKLNVQSDGDKVSYFDQEYKTQYRNKTPFSGGDWTDHNPNQGRTAPSWLGNQTLSSTETRQVATGKATGEAKTGRILNGAFISDDLYGKLNDTDKNYYGRTLDNAKSLDPRLEYSSRLVDNAYNYRRGRSRGVSLPGTPLAPLAAAPASAPQQRNKEVESTSRIKRGRTSSKTILSGGNLGGNSGKTILGA